jgi:hypothetical protein
VVDEHSDTILRGLHEAGVDFIIVGGTAAVLLGAPVVTEDVDIVHRKTPDNIERLLGWLLAHGAYHRFDLAKRRLPPDAAALAGHGHLNLQTDLGKVDVLCELGEGEDYEQVLADTIVLDQGAFPVRVITLPRLIAAKSRAGRPKDRLALPVLIATLDEQMRPKR